MSQSFDSRASGPQTAGGAAFSTKKDASRRAEEQVLGRVPPHSEEAEEAVLAGILTRPEALHNITDILSPEDFYHPAHAAIYKAFLSLDQQGKAIDLVLTAQELKDRNLLEQAGGAAYLGDLAQAVVSGAHAEFYAAIVRNKAVQRNLIEACARIIGNCFDAGNDVNRLLDESEQAVLAISQRMDRGNFSSTPELIDAVFDRLAKMSQSPTDVTGVSTGFHKLDKLTAGLQPSDLIIIAARPGMGKTAFAISLAVNAALSQGTPIAVFSLEMSREQLMQRMLAVQAKVDMSKLRQPARLKDEDWSNLYQAAEVLRGAPIFIDDTPALSTLELRSRARRLWTEHHLGLIVVDYLQLMRSSRRTDSRELEISDISRSLKSLAKELNIPVIALAQLNRKVEERTNKTPQLSERRESVAIEQDADVIMFIYREDAYAPKNASERPSPSVAKIIIGKQRNGPQGTAEIMYMAPYTAFFDMEPTWNTTPSENAQNGA